MKIEPLNRVAIANIDYPFYMATDGRPDLTPDGLPTTGFENVKKTVDRAKSLGFDAIAMRVNVPIDLSTGELVLMLPEGYRNRDKSFSPEIWKIIAYAESIGMKNIIDFSIVDVLTDVDLTKSRVGANFDVTKFFQSVKTFEVDVARQAQNYGVESIRIGMMNFGFSDNPSYKSYWQDLVDSIRKVYSGTLGYQDLLWEKNNIVWDMVDNAIVSFFPNLSATPVYDVEKLVDLYKTTQNQINQPHNHNPHTELLDFIARWKHKNIILNDIWFQPGQPGAGRYIDISSYVWKKGDLANEADEMRVFPENQIDYKSLETQIQAFFEYLGNYVADKVVGFEYFQYAPWADVAWLRSPKTFSDQSYQSTMRAKGFLNLTPQAEEAISQYISRDWGFKTLHYGTDKADQLAGSEVDDKFFGSTANDVMDGGSGKDTVKYTGKLTSYTVSRSANSVSVDKPNSGRDVLTNIERLVFDDRAVAFDADGTAGRGYRIYKAAFDRTPDTGGLGYWLAQMDRGMDMVEVAARFIDSAEFRTLYGQNPSNADFLSKVYNNVLDRNPDADGLAWWVNEMKTNPSKTWQKVLADFAESTENQANVATLIGNGIEYDPWSNVV
jgi:hypothetical protein